MFADTLIGSSAVNSIVGADGHEQLFGGAGDVAVS